MKHGGLSLTCFRSYINLKYNIYTHVCPWVPMLSEQCMPRATYWKYETIKLKPYFVETNILSNDLFAPNIASKIQLGAFISIGSKKDISSRNPNDQGTWINHTIKKQKKKKRKRKGRKGHHHSSIVKIMD